MTAQAIEAQALTYQTLDSWAEEIAAVVLAYWRLRPSMPEADWIALVSGVLAGMILRAEQAGRVYGSVAAPVDGDLLFPEVPSKPYRPVPDDFEQRSGIAPKPDDRIDFAARLDEVLEQVEKAVRTLAEEVERPATIEQAVDQPLERVERLARDEPIAAMQRGYQDAVRLQDRQIEGYRRGINPDACELCFWLWKEGFVYPIDQPMHRHVGCRCVPVPTTDSIGRHPLTEDDDAGRTALERYYSETLDETSYRRDGKNPTKQEDQ